MTTGRTTETTTQPSTTSSGWTAVAVLLGGCTALLVAGALWLAWILTGAFGFTQPVLWLNDHSLAALRPQRKGTPAPRQ